ncbi:DUF1971 domain-containing protein [Ensifer canadensis]|uniref:DUF1971 domain-containing protein n=1 Tax=Ensifer canadensis TaxID=555315 RepID=UPI0014906B17|nr:DUF1971 domain-containing protein [Ensifer canadensis]
MSVAQITEAQISLIVDRFYGAVRTDPILSEGFSPITDWDDHLQRMRDFWSSLLLATGRYKGNPVALHLIHATRIHPEMFERWLALWHRVTLDTVPADVAAELQIKARRIASRLTSALFGAEGPNLLSIRSTKPAQPYKSTPIFDESTIPEPLLRSHQLRRGTWAKLTVLAGNLRYHQYSRPPSSAEIHSSVIIPPEVPHHLEIVGPVKCQLHFYDHKPHLDCSIVIERKDNA